MVETRTSTVTLTESAPPIVIAQLKPRRNVQWREDTVDNEHMNKRKSKICCIYQKPRTCPSDTSSCSSDSDCGNNYDKFPRHQRKAMAAKQ